MSWLIVVQVLMVFSNMEFRKEEFRGPLLFTIYKNDFLNINFFGKLNQYVDICLVYPYNHKTALKTFMERELLYWLNFKLMYFCRRQNDI